MPNKNCKVTNMSITRDGNTIKASWKKPSNWKSNWNWTDVKFNFARANAKIVSTDVWRTPTSQQKPLSYTAADYYWLKGDNWDGTDQAKAYNRNRYHPVSPGKYCSGVSVGVHGGTFSGIRGYDTWGTYKFGLPRAPSKKIEFNNQTGVFTVTVTTNEGKDAYERYDTMIRVALRRTDGKEVSLMGWSSTRSTEWKKSFNVAGYLADMATGKYITLRVWAYARGMAGDNPTSKAATPTEYNVVWPGAPSIKKISLAGGMTPTGKIRVDVSTGGWGKNVQLQRRVGPEGSSWTNVSGAAGNQNIPAFFDNYGDIFPPAGVHVYYRMTATRENYTSYGNIVSADCIYTEKPKITAAAVVDTPSLSAYGDRTSIKVVMPWKDTDKNTGCELMYSEHSYFDSSSTQQYTGKDSKSAKSGRDTKTVRVYGFSPGKRYYFKFRRYRIYDNETYYSNWSGVANILMPESTNDLCAIKEPRSNELGTMALFTVVTNLKNALDDIGIEISYSESEDAWTSSSETPSTVTYEDVTLVNVTDSEWKSAWTKQVELALSNLTIGTKYYMKARIFGTFDGQTVYSGYSNVAMVTMQSAEDDKCSVSVASLSGGTRAVVTIEVNENSNNTGTEIQWSTYENSWYSNESPSSMKADWPLTDNTQIVYLSGLLPDTMYHIRARRYNDAGGNPGPWSEVVSFITFRDTAENDIVGIVSAIPDASGTSAEIIIGWQEDNQNIATEVSWSDNQQAWISNDSPSTMTIEWDEDPISKSEDWPHTQTMMLRNLVLGTTYYIKARRKNEDESGTTWTPYSPMATVTMPTKSENVEVRCGIVLLESGSDGSSAKVIVGWEGDHAGCEITWSSDPNAWESSEQPSSFEFDWSDTDPYPGHYESAEGIAFDESITFYTISGSGTTEDPYVYTVVDSPSLDGMYSYTLTDDDTVVETKTYYIRTGSGTEADPYEYDEVEDPQQEDIDTYYERTCNYYVLMDSWPNTSTCYIKGLEQGVLYYVRARSFGGGSKVYSAYTEDKTVMPFAHPDSVTLTVPAYVVRGKPIECWWEVASEMPQTEWAIHLAGFPNFSIAEGTGSLTHAIIDPDRYGDGDSITMYVEAGCGGGRTASGFVTVPVIDIPQCSAYGDEIVTEQPVSFDVYTDNPGSIIYATCYSHGCTLAAPNMDLDQLPGDSVWTSVITPSWSAAYWHDTDLYDGIVSEYEDALEAYSAAKVLFDATPEAIALSNLTIDDPEYSDAYDAAYSTPEGIALQNAEGSLDSAFNSYNSHNMFYLTSDISIDSEKRYYTRSGSGIVSDPYVYQEVLNPVTAELFHYYEAESLYSATVDMPVCDLYDNGSYWCEFSVSEKTAGVTSDIYSVEFKVEYEHQAPDIEDCVFIEPNYETRSVTIMAIVPEDSEPEDVYDIYRMTPTGFDLIRSGMEMGSQLEDYYAPFGHDELVYRVAIRTKDRDFKWLDFSYIMPVYVLRFDWEGESVEFPWNIEVRENMSKRFESRMHVDGSNNGYWDQGIEHKGSFSTDVRRVDDWELIKQARNIGSYPGAIFVRDSYGKAMQCNVELNEISIPNLSQVVGISFDFKSIKLTDQFKPENGEGA